MTELGCVLGQLLGLERGLERGLGSGSELPGLGLDEGSGCC